MLKLTIPAFDLWDEQNERFIPCDTTVIQLEHSLVSISKWEAKWEKPFLSTDMTAEQTVDYIKCMTLTQNVSPLVYSGLTIENFNKIHEYIAKPMTATWFNDSKKKKTNKEIITSEIIYYWMITLQIPMECQKWHLNRLLTLIRVCNDKNAPKEKMSKREIMDRNRALNEARRKAMNSKG